MSINYGTHHKSQFYSRPEKCPAQKRTSRCLCSKIELPVYVGNMMCTVYTSSSVISFEWYDSLKIWYGLDLKKVNLQIDSYNNIFFIIFYLFVTLTLKKAELKKYQGEMLHKTKPASFPIHPYLMSIDYLDAYCVFHEEILCCTGYIHITVYHKDTRRVLQSSASTPTQCLFPLITPMPPPGWPYIKKTT